MILLINVCKEKLHYLEFVKPIEAILNSGRISYLTKSYLQIEKKDFENCDKIIICGTSLQDNEFMKNISRFSWIKNAEQPILGICAGMQILGLAFGGMLKKKTEIGFYKEEFEKNFLGLKNLQEVYHLHNYYVDFSKLNDFEVYCSRNEISQAVKHKEKEIYGCLFHPEVRQKEIILKFAKS